MKMQILIIKIVLKRKLTQDMILITTYVTDKTGVCFLPTTYELSKSDEYADLLNDSNNRARYKE